MSTIQGLNMLGYKIGFKNKNKIKKYAYISLNTKQV